MAVEFYTFFKMRIQAMPYISATARGELYRAALVALENFISRTDPPLSRADADQVRGQISSAIDRIEDEFDLATHQGRRFPDWALTPNVGTKPVQSASAEDRQGSADDIARLETPPPSPYVAVSNEQLQQLVAISMSTRLSPAEFIARLFARFKSIFLALRYYVHATAGADKLGYMWMIFEPVMQIIIVVSMYWFFGIETIQGMPALPFAATGVSAWLMIRMSIMHISFGLGREAGLCVYPTIIPLDVKIAKTIFYSLIYFFVTLGFVLVCWSYGIIDGVKNTSLTISYWMLLMVMGLGMALILGRLFTVFPEVQRLIMVLIRALYLLSGAIVVTEQIPKDLAAYLLWNPMVHGMQLLRSSFFIDYQSTDANLTYFLFGTFFILTFGIICERANYKDEISA